MKKTQMSNNDILLFYCQLEKKIKKTDKKDDNFIFFNTSLKIINQLLDEIEEYECEKMRR